MKEIAYFDNAATTYVKPQIVHDFMHEFYMANSVNVGRGQHSLLDSSERLIMDTRKRLLKLFHATSDYEAVLVSSATESINIILQGTDFKKGDNVYISPFEHNAVYRVLKHLEKAKGINIHILEFDKETLEFKVDKTRFLFSQEPPAMVIVSHVSNVCGNIAPIEKIGKLAKQYNALYLIDCAQSAGLLDIDVVANQADFIVFAGHKTLYGPFGASGFICKKSCKLRPLIYGGTGIDSANEYMPKDIPTRFEAGSRNILSIAGLNAALKWHEDIGIEKIRKQENENYRNLYEILSSNKSIRMIDKSNQAVSIISCLFKNQSPDDSGIQLSNIGIMVRTGLHCAPLAHSFLQTAPSGTVRFSVSYFSDISLLKSLWRNII